VIVPLTFAALDEAEEVDPPPELLVLLSSLLPHAAAPSASASATPAASHLFDLTVNTPQFRCLGSGRAGCNAWRRSLLPTCRRDVKWM
jgi:hypothetical protein